MRSTSGVRSDDRSIKSGATTARTARFIKLSIHINYTPLATRQASAAPDGSSATGRCRFVSVKDVHLSHRRVTALDQSAAIDQIIGFFGAVLKDKLAEISRKHGGQNSQGRRQLETVLSGGSRVSSGDASAIFEGITFGATIRKRDDEGVDGGGPSSKHQRTDSEASAGLACPFLKHNHERYRDWRSCAGSRWPTVHRVKEHLYRRHQLPKHRCNRCREAFESAEQLSGHQRGVPCEVEETQLQDGIDEATLQLLRSRKKPKGQGELSEEEKWGNVYTILFPGEPAPSPYHIVNYDVSGEQSRLTSNVHEMLKELDDYAQAELPRLLRPQLEAVLQNSDGGGGNAADKMLGAARGVFQQIIRAFREANGNGGGGGGALSSSMTTTSSECAAGGPPSDWPSPESSAVLHAAAAASAETAAHHGRSADDAGPSLGGAGDVDFEAALQDFDQMPDINSLLQSADLLDWNSITDWIQVREDLA